MSKLNDFFEKKKQKSKGLNELMSSRKTIGGLKVTTNESTISSVISEANIDDWSINTDIKEPSDFFMLNKNLPSEGLKKTNSQLVVAVKTSKPDFDSNIWKSKSNDSSTNNNNLLSSKSNDDNDNKRSEDIEKEKPKETIKYNVRARLAARGQKVGFLNARDAINSMPTLAAAVANVNKPKLSSNSQLNINSINNQNLSEKNLVSNQQKNKDENKNEIENNIIHNNDIKKNDASCQQMTQDQENNQKNETNDLDVIKQLRTCNVKYLNNNIIFNCIIDIEQSRIKYSNIVRDF